MSSTRSVKSPGIFADAASTVIPPTPIAGVSYRDATNGAANTDDGWPYAIRVNSAEFNQIMFQYSSLLTLLDKQGLLGWTNLVDYLVPAIVFGSDGKIYKSLQVSGPATTVKDPVSEPTYWAELLPDQAAVVGAASNLAAVATGANAIATISASEIVVESSGNAYKTLRAVSVSPNLAAAGANGLDTGTVAINTFYYGYVIWNGTTIAGLWSLSPTAPTMPAGYTHKALATVGQTGATSLVKKYNQLCRNVYIADTNAFSALAASVANTYQVFSAAAIIPPIAKSIGGTVGCVAGNNSVITLAGDNTGTGAKQHNALGATSYDGFFVASPFSDIPIITSQNFFWKSFDTAARSRVNISQFTF